MKASGPYEQALRAAKRRKPDLQSAFKLLQRASNGGDARADYALATWYLHGKHVPRNPRKAVQLLRVAAAAGIADAMFDLGVSFEKGVGVPKNVRRAAECYLRCAVSGGREAFYEVGRCYYYGIGFDKDQRLARIWLDAARSVSSARKSKSAPVRR